MDVSEVGIGYFCAHGNFGGGLDGGLQIFWKDDSKVSRSGARPEACVRCKNGQKTCNNDLIPMSFTTFAYARLSEMIFDISGKCQPYHS